MNQIPTNEEPINYYNSAFENDDFVVVSNSDYILVEMQYPILNMENAENKCFLRKKTYKKLLDATKKLPNGYKFKIFDAWRPFALQKELYEKYSLNIISEFGLENESEEKKAQFIKKFVSEPIYDKEQPPVHTTGGAIDLTLIDSNNVELEMGSGFDEFTDKTYTDFYEKSSNETIKFNRRLLYWIMIDSGFTNLPSEWWHYDYGDRFWGYYTKKNTMFKGVFEREDIYAK